MSMHRAAYGVLIAWVLAALASCAVVPSSLGARQPMQPMLGGNMQDLMMEMARQRGIIDTSLTAPNGQEQPGNYSKNRIENREYAGCRGQAMRYIEQLPNNHPPSEQDYAVLRRGIDECRQNHDRSGERFLLQMLGNILLVNHQADQALTVFKQALPLAEDPQDKVTSLEDIGRAQLLLNRPDQARQSTEQALQIARQTDQDYLQVQALKGLGFVYIAKNNNPKAIETLQLGLYQPEKGSYRNGSNDNEFAGWLYSGLGLAYYRQGDLKAAEAALQAALAVPLSFQSQTAGMAELLEQNAGIAALAKAVSGANASPIFAHMGDMASIFVDGYTCSLLQEILVKQERVGAGLVTAESCRGRSMAQHLNQTTQHWYTQAASGRG